MQSEQELDGGSWFYVVPYARKLATDGGKTSERQEGPQAMVAILQDRGNVDGKTMLRKVSYCSSPLSGAGIGKNAVDFG